MNGDDTRRDVPAVAFRVSRRGLIKGMGAVGLAAPFVSMAGRFAPALAADASLEPLIAAAKKEGGVIALGNTLQGGEVRQEMAKLFRTRYGLPDNFNVEFIIKPSGQVQKQIEDELAANKVMTDVMSMNIPSWIASLVKREAVMAFDAPEYAGYEAFKGQPVFYGVPYFVSDPTIIASIAWNTKLIKDATFTSWFDLLKPQYSGKITTLSARLSPAWAVTYKAMRDHPAIGMKFFEGLAKLKPVIIPASNNAVDKVVSGEFPITISPASRVLTAFRQGAPVNQSFPKEGIVPSPVAWVAFKNAPRPNAAKLMVNFIRSREAQQMMADLDGRVSGRRDIKSPDERFVPSIQDLTLIPSDELAINEAEYREIGREWQDMFGL